MKKILTALMLSLLLMAPIHQAQAQIPIIDIIKTVIKKVIRAIDLQIQRQQNKVMFLQNAQKELENEMSKLKLKDISDWTEKQRKLYDDYFQELKKVKDAISTYRKVKEIIQQQVELVNEYQRAWALLRQDKNFTPAEIDEMYTVYTGIIDESLKNIDQLIMVTSSFKTQMTDGARLELMNRSGKQVDQNLTEMRNFNNRNFQLSISRANDAQQADMLKKMYGL